MLEMKVFRENPDAIFNDLKRRKSSTEIANDVIKFDKAWRELVEEGNRLRAQRNNISREVGDLKKKGEDATLIMEKMAGIKEKLILNENFFLSKKPSVL